MRHKWLCGLLSQMLRSSAHLRSPVKGGQQRQVCAIAHMHPLQALNPIYRSGQHSAVLLPYTFAHLRSPVSGASSVISALSSARGHVVYDSAREVREVSSASRWNE